MRIGPSCGKSNTPALTAITNQGVYTVPESSHAMICCCLRLAAQLEHRLDHSILD